MNQDQLKRAEALASRPYQIELQAYKTPNGDPYFFGRVPEMPGCVSDGETEHKAKKNVRLAMIDFIYFLLEDELCVPEPRPIDNFTAISIRHDIEYISSSKRETDYRRLSIGSSYGATGDTANHLDRQVYVA